MHKTEPTMSPRNHTQNNSNNNDDKCYHASHYQEMSYKQDEEGHYDCYEVNLNDNEPDEYIEEVIIEDDENDYVEYFVDEEDEEASFAEDSVSQDDYLLTLKPVSRDNISLISFDADEDFFEYEEIEIQEEEIVAADAPPIKPLQRRPSLSSITELETVKENDSDLETVSKEEESEPSSSYEVASTSGSADVEYESYICSGKDWLYSPRTVIDTFGLQQSGKQQLAVVDSASTRKKDKIMKEESSDDVPSLPYGDSIASLPSQLTGECGDSMTSLPSQLTGECETSQSQLRSLPYDDSVPSLPSQLTGESETSKSQLPNFEGDVTSAMNEVQVVMMDSESESGIPCVIEKKETDINSIPSQRIVASERDTMVPHTNKPTATTFDSVKHELRSLIAAEHVPDESYCDGHSSFSRSQSSHKSGDGESRSIRSTRSRNSPRSPSKKNKNSPRSSSKKRDGLDARHRSRSKNRRSDNTNSTNRNSSRSVHHKHRHGEKDQDGSTHSRSRSSRTRSRSSESLHKKENHSTRSSRSRSSRTRSRSSENQHKKENHSTRSGRSRSSRAKSRSSDRRQRKEHDDNLSKSPSRSRHSSSRRSCSRQLLDVFSPEKKRPDTFETKRTSPPPPPPLPLSSPVISSSKYLTSPVRRRRKIHERSVKSEGSRRSRPQSSGTLVTDNCSTTYRNSSHHGHSVQSEGSRRSHPQSSERLDRDKGSTTSSSSSHHGRSKNEDHRAFSSITEKKLQQFASTLQADINAKTSTGKGCSTIEEELLEFVLALNEVSGSRSFSLEDILQRSQRNLRETTTNNQGSMSVREARTCSTTSPSRSRRRAHSNPKRHRSLSSGLHL